MHEGMTTIETLQSGGVQLDMAVATANRSPQFSDLPPKLFYRIGGIASPQLLLRLTTFAANSGQNNIGVENLPDSLIDEINQQTHNLNCLQELPLEILRMILHIVINDTRGAPFTRFRHYGETFQLAPPMEFSYGQLLWVNNRFNQESYSIIYTGCRVDLAIDHNFSDEIVRNVIESISKCPGIRDTHCVEIPGGEWTSYAEILCKFSSLQELHLLCNWKVTTGQLGVQTGFVLLENTEVDSVTMVVSTDSPPTGKPEQVAATLMGILGGGIPTYVFHHLYTEIRLKLTEAQIHTLRQVAEWRRS